MTYENPIWGLPEGIGKPPTPEPEPEWDEHRHQVEVIAWFRRHYSDTRIIAIPNGGMRPSGRTQGGARGRQAQGRGGGIRCA